MRWSIFRQLRGSDKNSAGTGAESRRSGGTGWQSGILIRLKRTLCLRHWNRWTLPAKLNVTLLHRLILEDFLGLQGDTLQKNVRYIRGEDQALNLLRSGDANGAFLLRGIAPQDVFQVSQQGVRMPQKSTDFYPKIPTGLVLRSVKDSRDEHENH